MMNETAYAGLSNLEFRPWRITPVTDKELPYRA